MLRLVSLAALLTHATAYYRAAIDVTGAVVADAGNLTAGGKVGTYTVLLQVLNPGLGDLKLLLECCGDARDYASEIASKVNLNMIQGSDQEETIRKNYVGDGKCSAPGPIASLAKKGNKKCNYVYSFANKAWKQYQYTAQCIPSDVCAVDVVGATKGLKVAYPVVIQVLNRNAGDLFYAGHGPIGSCLEGMNQVNMANVAAKKEETSIKIFGKTIPTGFKEVMHIDGMEQLKVTDMFSKCEDTSDTGILYVFKNKFWINTQHAMNITDFDLQQEMAQRKKDLEELMNYKLPKKGEKPAPKKEKPEGLGIAAAMGKLGGKVESTLEKEPSVKVADIQKDVDEAEDEIEEKEEAEKEKFEKEQKELKEWEKKFEEEQKKKVLEEALENVKEKKKALKETVEKAKEEAKKQTEAPEVPKVPELPKVEVPEPPKAPEVPKVEAPEAPEAPKAPEVPKVETVQDKAKKAAEDLAKKVAEEKEKAATKEVSARRLEAEHIMV